MRLVKGSSITVFGLKSAMTLYKSSKCISKPKKEGLVDTIFKSPSFTNGFKPKTLDTRVGSIQFQVPQVRGGLEFYPSALEKGVRSEQALKLALAEMYVQGVSTRKVSAIVEQLCGSSVSSTQVSQCAAKLDTQLQELRSP